MSYDKEDFIVMPTAEGHHVIVNISKIKFVVPEGKGLCNLFFGGGDDDYLIVKCTIDELMDLL